MFILHIGNLVICDRNAYRMLEARVDTHKWLAEFWKEEWIKLNKKFCDLKKLDRKESM